MYYIIYEVNQLIKEYFKFIKFQFINDINLFYYILVYSLYKAI